MRLLELHTTHTHTHRYTHSLLTQVSEQRQGEDDDKGDQQHQVVPISIPLSATQNIPEIKQMFRI